MPARLIREGLLDSPRVCRLPLEARWLFVTICLSADDVGLFDAEPFALMRKAELQRELGPDLLVILRDADLVRLYSVPSKPGKVFGFVPRYGQRLQMRKVRYPLPPLAIAQDDPDALKKINDLASRSRCFTVTHGASPSEAEAEAEEKKGAVSSSISSVFANPLRGPATKAKKTTTKAAAKTKPAAKKALVYARKCPLSFVLTPALAMWAAKEYPGVDVEEELATMRDHTFATARTDWDGTFRNWIRKASQNVKAKGGPKSFRERDAAAAHAEAAQWAGGRVARKTPPQRGEIIDMEPGEQTHERLGGD